MDEQIYIIIQNTSKSIDVKAYNSLRRLCKEHGFEYKEVKDKLPFKYREFTVLKSKLDSRV